jgi:hypothetical protein
MADLQVIDRDGHRYTLSILKDDVRLFLRLYDRETLVGEAKCIQESSDRFLLGDIAIANEVIRPLNHRWTIGFSKLLGYQPRLINYRVKGLGSALLTFLIDYARQAGVCHLYGKVMQQDVENNPKLIQWYQKHGFTTRDPAPDDDEDILTWIHLDL